MKRKKEERRLWPAALTNTEVMRIYLAVAFLQPFRVASRNGELKGGAADRSQQQDERSCVRCGTIVTNDSLGGHDHASAFYDPIYCYPCADGFDPFLPNQREVIE